MPSGAIITTLGLAKLASATPLNQLNISALAVGDGNGGYPTLDPSMTTLTNEVWRGTPSPPIRDPNSPNVLIFEAVIPPNVGGFTVREQAIFDDAGDMIAIGQTSVVEKPLPNAATGVILTVRLHVQLDNAEQVDLFFQDDPTISAGNVLDANGGSVQDFIDAQYTTVAELATGKFQVGTYVRLTDRAMGLFLLQSGGYPDVYGLLDAGNSNTAAIQTDGNSVKIRELGYTFGVDASPFISYAATNGYKEILLPKSSEVLMSEITSINSTWGGVTIKGAGSGLAYTPNTRVKPVGSQASLFTSLTGVGGADSITFDNMMLDGNGQCVDGVKQLSGAGWNFTNLQIKGFTGWGLYSVQGLNYYNRVYGNGNGGLGVIAAYSDSILNTVEATGGEEPIKVMAGGCRLDNILANSGTESCITLEPLDTNTNHVNTAMSNIYIGETVNAVEKPILKIVGNAVRRVTDVQMVNVHTVSAAATGIKHNRHINISKADRVTINGWAALGIGDFETANLWDAGGLLATDSNDIVIASGTIHNLSKEPVKAVNSSVTIANGVKITNWSGAFDTTQNKAAVESDNLSKVYINDGATIVNLRVSATKAGYAPDGALWQIGSVNTFIAGTAQDSQFVFDTNPAGWVITNSSSDAVFKGSTTYSGTVNTPAGGGSVALKTFPSVAYDRNYEVTVQQVGTGTNATVGMAFTNGGTLGAVTLGNTNTLPALQNTITSVGGVLTFTSGTGYGLTTWRYNITRRT